MYFRYFDLHLGCGGVEHVAAVEEVTVLRVPHQRQRLVPAGRHLAREQSSRRSCSALVMTLFMDEPHQLVRSSPMAAMVSTRPHVESMVTMTSASAQCQCPPRPAVRRGLMGPSQGSARHSSDRHTYRGSQ